MAKQSFQLKPKHLITATLAVCALAVVGLIIGVIGTFNPRDEERAKEEQAQKKNNQVNRVEVWKPDGANTQGTIVLNPDAVNQPQQPVKARTDASDNEEQESRNPFLPSAPSRSREEARGGDEEQTRRARPRHEHDRERSRPRPLETKPAAATPSLQNPIPTPPAETSVPVRPRPEPKPEADKPKVEPKSEPKPEPKPERRAEPKPEPRPAPAPKPQQKEVIDNLF